jgi:hypothetical protein
MTDSSVLTTYMMILEQWEGMSDQDSELSEDLLGQLDDLWFKLSVTERHEVFARIAKKESE